MTTTKTTKRGNNGAGVAARTFEVERLIRSELNDHFSLLQSRNRKSREVISPGSSP